MAPGDSTGRGGAGGVRSSDARRGRLLPAREEQEGRRRCPAVAKEGGADGVPGRNGKREEEGKAVGPSQISPNKHLLDGLIFLRGLI